MAEAAKFVQADMPPDEPLSNLDASLRLADKVVVMNRGRIEEEDMADEAYRRPSGLFVELD